MKFAKNIQYEESYDAESVRRLQSLYGTRKSSPYLTRWFYSVTGGQFVVNKKVSDDLAQTDIQNIGTDDLVFPHPAIEFFFEDQNLPTILLGRATIEELGEAIGLRIANPQNPEAIRFYVCLDEIIDGERNALYMVLEESDMKRFMKGWVFPDKMQYSLPEEHTVFMRDMLKLVFAVLIYASIPEYKPQKATRKQLHKGGKSGVKNRPQRPMYRVLPPVIYEKNDESKQSPSSEQGNVRAAHSRRGHLRKLKHKRFTRKKGQIVYVAPCFVGKGDHKRPTYKITER